jgi:uncharacterized protein (TIGR02453 family)
MRIELRRFRWLILRMVPGRVPAAPELWWRRRLWNASFVVTMESFDQSEEAPAMPAATETFTGFQPDAVQFLADLAANNDRAWFQPRKAEYERLLKGPLEALCVAMADRFAAAGLPFSADPARSPFRIYRDVRFAKDKSPYKTNIGAAFPWIGDGEGRPAGYFHLEPGEAFVGGGMWHPEKASLDAFRRLLDTDPGRVHAVIDDRAFVATFGRLSGDRLTRVPQGYRPDHPEAEYLKLKDMTFGHRLSDVDVYAPDLPDRLVTSLTAAVPAMRLLATLPIS